MDECGTPGNGVRAHSFQVITPFFLISPLEAFHNLHQNGWLSILQAWHRGCPTSQPPNEGKLFLAIEYLQGDTLVVIQ
jgi:hypothetical protein